MLAFILYVILGFYLLGLIGRFFLRRWVAKKQKEFEANGGSPGGFYRTYTWGGRGKNTEKEQKPEGDITIQRTQISEKKVSGTIGDYVEYEEVEVNIEEKKEDCK